MSEIHICRLIALVKIICIQSTDRNIPMCFNSLPAVRSRVCLKLQCSPQLNNWFWQSIQKMQASRSCAHFPTYHQPKSILQTFNLPHTSRINNRTTKWFHFCRFLPYSYVSFVHPWWGFQLQKCQLQLMMMAEVTTIEHVISRARCSGFCYHDSHCPPGCERCRYFYDSKGSPSFVLGCI